MTIIKEYIKEGKKNRPGPRKGPAQWIVIHETDNSARGADAQSYADFMSSPTAASQPVSWHYTVDDSQIFQSLPDEEMAFHCGTRMGYGSANVSGLGVTLCVNFDGRFLDTMNLAAQLTAQLLTVHRLPLSAVRPADDFMQNGAPRRIREVGGWGDFIGMVETAMEPEAWAQRDYDALLSAGVMLGTPRWGMPVVYEDMVSALHKLWRAVEFDMSAQTEQMQGLMAAVATMTSARQPVPAKPAPEQNAPEPEVQADGQQAAAPAKPKKPRSSSAGSVTAKAAETPPGDG